MTRPPNGKRRPGGGGAHPSRSSSGVPLTYRKPIDRATERVIRITPEVFGSRVDVKVRPPVREENLDADFRTYRDAKLWAEGLRRLRGWRIIDECGEDAE